MRRVLIILLSLFLLTLLALATEETAPEDWPPADEDPFQDAEWTTPEEALPVSGDIYLDLTDFLDDSEPAGEGDYEQLYTELAQLRANTDYIFLGVIALSGVVLGCFVGVTLMRLWGA